MKLHSEYKGQQEDKKIKGNEEEIYMSIELGTSRRKQGI
jgi:hypothetical protein